MHKLRLISSDSGYEVVFWTEEDSKWNWNNIEVCTSAVNLFFPEYEDYGFIEVSLLKSKPKRASRVLEILVSDSHTDVISSRMITSVDILVKLDGELVSDEYSCKVLDILFQMGLDLSKPQKFYLAAKNF